MRKKCLEKETKARQLGKEEVGGKRERKGAGGKEKQDKVHFSSLLPCSIHSSIPSSLTQAERLMSIVSECVHESSMLLCLS